MSEGLHNTQMKSIPTECKNEDSPLNGIQIEMTMENNSKASHQTALMKSKTYLKYQDKLQNNSMMASKVQNANVYNVEKYQKKEAIDYERFKEKVDKLHMRKMNPITKKQDLNYTCCGDVICGTPTGCHCCCYTTEKTAVDERGVGVTLYFKGLKHLIWNYLCLTIISFPILFFSIYASHNNSVDVTDFQSALETTTVGNIGADARQCFKDVFTSTTTTQYIMKCDTGSLAMSQTFIYGLYYKSTDKTDFNEQSCFFADESRLDKSKNKDKSSITQITQCQDQSNCTFTKADIMNMFTITDYTDVQFFIKSYCQGTVYTFRGVTFQKKYVAYIIAGIDAFIVLYYFCMVYFSGSAEAKSINHILKTKRTPSHFTIQIKNLPEKIKSEADLMADLHQHLERVVSAFAKREKFDKPIKIIDVKISESQLEIQEQRKKGIISKQNLVRINDFLLKYDKEKTIITDRSKVEVKDLTKVIDELRDEKLKKSATKEFTVISEAYVTIGKAVEKITKIEEKSTIKYAWVTFDSIQMKNIADEQLSSTTMERFCAFICGCCTCCVPRDKVFQGRIMDVENAPNPDSILWENNDSKGLFLRKIISIIFTVGVLVGSYVLIVWIRNAKQDIQQRYPQVDCSNPIFNNILEQAGLNNVVNESNQPSDQTKVGYIQCYCKKEINSIFSGSLKQPYKSICNSWLTDYTLSQFLPYAAVICIIIINMIIQVLFQALSKFEKYKLLDDEFKSNIIKTFVAQFINTGLILLLTNINFDVTTQSGLEFLFGGNYNDLSPEWFKNVGTVIILTLLINVISAPLISFIFTLIRECGRWCDRRCSGDPKITKKQRLSEWVAYYTGPEFLISFRYSQILGICFIGMLYSGGIPILYFTSFLHLTVLYWLDKIYLFKVCKVPLNFDQQMATMVRQMLYAVPFLHTVFSIYIYGNTDIFFEIQYLSESWFNVSSGNAVAQQFIERVLQRQQNIAHAIILGVLLLLFLLRIFLFKPLKAVANLCLQKSGMEKYMNKGPKTAGFLHNSYYNYLSVDQLGEENRLLEFYLNEEDLKAESEKCPKQEKYLKEKKEEVTLTFNAMKAADQNTSQIVGIPSYDIRMNPVYKPLYNWDKDIRSASRSMHKPQMVNNSQKA